MKVINKCKKAAILATVLGGICFGATADAATVLIGGATDYSTGTQIGALNGSWVTSYVDTKVISDVKQQWFNYDKFCEYEELADDYYNKAARTDNNTSISELIVGKHRNGTTGTINLLFKRDTSTFLNFTNEGSEVSE